MSTATSTDIAVDIAVDSTYSKHDPVFLPQMLRSSVVEITSYVCRNSIYSTKTIFLSNIGE